MSRRSARTSALVVSALLAALVPALGPAVVSPASADQRTVSVDTLRTSWDPAEPTLTPATVTSSDFGPVFDATLDGQVYAQPLVDGSSLYVTTEKAKAYALARSDGSVAWSRSFGSPFQAASVGCGDLVPDLGSTSTGVIDPATRTWYFTTKLAVGNGDAAWWLQGVSLDTGEDRPGFPVQIQGSPDNDPSTVFSARTQHQRPGLLLLAGVVYVGFGAHCDVTPFKGYVVGVSTTTHTMTAMWTTAVGGGLSGGGIWQAGGGLVSDGPDRIMFSTGNGFFGGSQSGTPGLLAESVVRLRVKSDGTLVTSDWFTPSNAKVLDSNDQDLGSGAPTALPDSFGTATHPHLMIVDGKDGRMFVLDRDDLGKYGAGPGGTDRIVSTTSNVGGLWGHPAFFGGGGGYAYVAPTTQPLKALAYGVDGAGVPRFTVVGTSTASYGYTSGSPVVTSDGTNASSGLVWVLYSSGPTGAGGELRAYDAVPTDGVLTLRWHAAVGTVSKFSQPVTDGGVVYVGTRDGHVLAFGRPQAGAIGSSPVELGSTPVATTVAGTATLTAAKTLTVSDITTSAPFSLTAPTLPVTLNAGDSLAVPVGFSPTAPGDAVGQVVVTTTEGTFSTGLHGIATKDGLAASPGTVAFGDQPTGLPRTLSVVVSNTGATDTHITGVSSPAPAFTLSGSPDGATIHPGASVTIGITFTPSAVGPATSSFLVSSSTGTVTVAITGNAMSGTSELDTTPTTLDFGVVPVGKTLSMTFEVDRVGNLPLTITKAKAPTSPFGTDSPMSEGTVIGDVPLTQEVHFTPTQAGFFTAYYEITGDDGTGPHYVILHGLATTAVAAVAPSPVAGGWQLNGTSRVSGQDLVLTSGTVDSAGDAVYPQLLSTQNLYVRFRTTISGLPGGGEGIALGLLDATTESPGSLGSPGAGLGVGGLHGVAVTADSVRSYSTEPPGPFTGIVTDVAAGPVNPHYVATAPIPGGLRNTARVFTVTYAAGVLSVYVDGRRATSTPVALPDSVLLAFTAATGARPDTQSVRDIVVGRIPVSDTVSGTTGWALNGGAAARASWTALTAAAPRRAGSAVRARRLSTAELTAAFTVALSGGTGGDGMTFAMLDPAATTARSVGAAGGGLGFAGLSGTAVTLTTARVRGKPPVDAVGVATSIRGGGLRSLARTTKVPDLRRGSHAVLVRTWQGHLLVSVDGTQVLDAVVPVPPTAYVAFTASTGTATDWHRVARVTVSAVRTAEGSPVTGSGWQRNGSTTVVGSSVRLTAATRSQRGTTFATDLFSSTGLRIRYVSTVAPGTHGADGMALALVGPSVAPTSVGAPGGGVGWSGLGGVAVVQDSYVNTGDPGRDFVGVATGIRGALDRLDYVQHTAPGGRLSGGTHVIDVCYVDGRLRVWIDGVPRLSPYVVLPALVRVGFTASTGGLADAHSVSAVSFTSW